MITNCRPTGLQTSALRLPLLVALFAALLQPAIKPTQGADDLAQRWGHSAHGKAWDEGPRSRPWLMEGIGRTPFPVTSKHPEVQQWFDQGHTLLHGFWYFEAERAFRWCIKLDPDCAMAYWGLARCRVRTQDGLDRARAFLKEAL